MSFSIVYFPSLFSVQPTENKGGTLILQMCTHNMEHTLSNTSPWRYFSLIKYTDTYWALKPVQGRCESEETLTAHSWVSCLENNNADIKVKLSELLKMEEKENPKHINLGKVLIMDIFQEGNLAVLSSHLLSFLIRELLPLQQSNLYCIGLL